MTDQLKMEWQPIETAPRDGTPHIRGLYVHQKRSGMVDYVFWCCFIGYIEPEHGAFVSIEGDDLGWDADYFSQIGRAHV